MLHSVSNFCVIITICYDFLMELSENPINFGVRVVKNLVFNRMGTVDHSATGKVPQPLPPPQVEAATILQIVATIQ